MRMSRQSGTTAPCRQHTNATRHRAPTWAHASSGTNPAKTPPPSHPPGGEFGCALTDLVETAPHATRGFSGGKGFAGALGGIAIGVMLVMIVTAACTPAQLALYGWRCAARRGGRDLRFSGNSRHSRSIS